MFEATIADGALELHRPGIHWLSTGWDGGFERAAAAYNITVPEGWERTDLGTYISERRERAGFTASGPTLLTGVEMRHARGARLDPVVAYATVGLSNPAALPMEPTGAGEERHDRPSDVGTVNLLIGTTRCLSKAALATFLGIVVEAKTATLLAESGFPGTTTDAVVVGSDEMVEPATFAGSATPVGAAARACVREAVRASFRSRYAEREVASSVADAEHGVVTDRRAEVFTP
ncbi:adenosylcobinamide amidohydrolase [Halococcus sediminicola]|uniref:adenosylcobinamide amidohydrolase n=1 Tax=Halococcus sediminicola TaxID=1264579 RepID=UPI000678C082|nr:adenosylcobinamide amidohydrolase [Halococcus sediminicola]